jgi:hypothetical protein
MIPLAVEGSYTIQDKQTGKTVLQPQRHPGCSGQSLPIRMEISGWIWATRSAFMAALIPTRPNENGCISLAEDSRLMTCTAFCRGVHL